MSLMRLLTVGRSLGKVTDQPSRYRLMTQQSLLPKFGSAKTPDGPEVGTDQTTSAAQDSPPEQKVSEALAGSSKTAPDSPMKEMNSMNTVPPTPPVALAAAQPLSGQRFPQGRWTLFKNPFSGDKPKTAEAPVQ